MQLDASDGPSTGQAEGHGDGLLTQTPVRCNTSFNRLFAKILRPRSQDPAPPNVLLEFACELCRKDLERATGNKVYRLLHRFDLDGRLVESETIPWRPRTPRQASGRSQLVTDDVRETPRSAAR